MQFSSCKKYLLRPVISLALSTIVALLLLLFFSVIVYFTGANDFVLKLINFVIRLFSVCVCVFIFAPESKGILIGGVLGVLSFALTQLTFSLLFSGAVLSNFLLNGVFSAIFGAIFGIICVNLKNRAKST